MTISTWVVLIVGLCASVTGAFVWSHQLEQRRRAQFQPIAHDVAQTIDAAMRQDDGITVITRSLVELTPHLTNRDVDAWFRSIDGEHRYPELGGFQYIEHVPAGDLATFGAEAHADPIPGAQPFDVAAINPPGLRDSYCLSRYEIMRDDWSAFKQAGGVTASIDWCTTALAGQLSAAADSGNPVEISIADLASAVSPLIAGQLGLSPDAVQQQTKAFLAQQSRAVLIFAPAYRDGVAPDSVEGRRASLIGWLAGIYDVGQAIDHAVGDPPRFAATISRQDGSPLTIASTSVATVQGPLAFRTDIEHNGRWSVLVVGDASGGASPAKEALPALLGGILLTLLLFSLLRVLANGRRRALVMVDSKTSELQHQALHDSLTGLANRALLLDRTEHLLARARRGRATVSMLFIDLDDFKDVNDTAGHAAGDELLRLVATRLASVVRKSDTVARLGGDEFIVVTENDSGFDSPELLARRLLESLDAPFHLATSDVSYVVNASIGIATGLDIAAVELLRNADIALYQAKSAGKHRSVVFEPRMQHEVEQRIELDTELRGALERGEFSLEYQPMYSIHNVTLTGVEALLRWNSRRYGEISPMEFVPLLEHNGLILPVGRWVLQTACRQAAEWHDAGHPLSVSVNVSGMQLNSGTFVAEVAETLAFTGIEPYSLVLEITESTLMLDAEASTERLAALKALGVRVAIDDFGTGYSSLSYIRRFPIDVLKIDRSFVASMAESEESRALVRTLIQLAKALRLQTVAEGIEHIDQLEHLRAEGCDTGQGFLLSRPIPPAEVSGLLAHRSQQDFSLSDSGPLSLVHTTA